MTVVWWWKRHAQMAIVAPLLPWWVFVLGWLKFNPEGLTVHTCTVLRRNLHQIYRVFYSLYTFLSLFDIMSWSLQLVIPFPRTGIVLQIFSNLAQIFRSHSRPHYNSNHRSISNVYCCPTKLLPRLPHRSSILFQLLLNALKFHQLINQIIQISSTDN